MRVSQLTVQAQPTAVIAETTSWEAYPEIWPRLLDEVWSAVRPRRSEIAPGRNVMPYKDDVPNVEVGVEIAGSFAPAGRIIASALPAGRVAMTTNRGSWDVGPENLSRPFPRSTSEDEPPAPSNELARERHRRRASSTASAARSSAA